MYASQQGKLLRSRYRVLAPLGKGGFGQTFIAEDLDLPNYPRCVVKQLKPASSDRYFLENARRLFQSEAQSLMRLGSHEQIPRLLAYFEEDQEFYLVQELVEGHPLSDELPLGKHWAESEVCELLYEVLNILQFIHAQGVIHRDLKPDNLIRRHSDRKPVLVDFGTVKEIRTPGLTRRSRTTSVATIAVGTPGYMPTEQGRGKPRPNSDIYALGVIGIQAVTGLSPDQLQEDSETGELIWRPWAQVSDRLAEILTQMVRYYFRDRYQTAQQVLSDLAPLLGLSIPVQESEVREPVPTLVSLEAPPPIETWVSPPVESEIPPPIETEVFVPPVVEEPIQTPLPPESSQSTSQVEDLKSASQSSSRIQRTVLQLPKSVFAIAGISAIGLAIASLSFLVKQPQSETPIVSSSPAQQNQIDPDQVTLDAAIALAKDNQIASLNQAVEKLKTIKSSSSIYAKAQDQQLVWQKKLLQNYLQNEVPKKYPKIADIVPQAKPEIKQLDANEIVISYDSSSNPDFNDPEVIKNFSIVFMELLRGNQRDVSQRYSNFNQIAVYPTQGKQKAILHSKDWDAYVKAGAEGDQILETVKLSDR